MSQNRNMNGEGYYRCVYGNDCPRCRTIRRIPEFRNAVVYHKLATLTIGNPYRYKTFEWTKVGPKTYIHLGPKR